MSRRTFIKQSCLFAGAMFLENKVFAGWDNKSARPKINVGIIGCGDRGLGIMKVMNKMNDLFSINAVCDVLDFRLKNAADVVSCKAYKDHLQLLEDKNVDAVIIATPLNLHFDIARNALAAGKHVYLEKTMTYNKEQALELVKLQQQHGGQVLQVGHQYRYSPLYYKVREMIGKGYLGKVTQIDTRWDRNGNWRRPVPDPSLERQINWRMYKEYSGGLAAELLSHQIDFINWAFDTQPDEIYATGGIDFYKDGRETFDNLQAVLRYNSARMVGNFGATCANAHDGYLFKIKGSKGSVSLLMNEGMFYPEKETMKELQLVDGVTGATKIEWNKDGGVAILPEPTRDGTWYALNEFYKCVETNTLPDSNVFTGARTAVTVDLINQSAYTNSIQHWSPAYNLAGR